MEWRGKESAASFFAKEGEEAKGESRNARIDLSSSARRPFSNFRSAGESYANLPLSCISLDGGRGERKTVGYLRKTRSTRSEEGLSLMATAEWRGVSELLQPRHRIPENATALLCLGWPILLLPIFRTVARAYEKSPEEEPQQGTSRRIPSRCFSFGRSGLRVRKPHSPFSKFIL